MADPIQSISDQEITPPGQTPIKVYQSLMRDYLRKNVGDGNQTTLNHQNQDSALRNLNQISALLMLLEQFPLAPDDYALDILAWKPEPCISEQLHSVHAIVPDQNNKKLSSIIEELQTTSIQLVERLRLAMESGELDQLLLLCNESTPVLRARVTELTAQIKA